MRTGRVPKSSYSDNCCGLNTRNILHSSDSQVPIYFISFLSYWLFSLWKNGNALRSTGMGAPCVKPLRYGSLVQDRLISDSPATDL